MSINVKNYSQLCIIWQKNMFYVNDICILHKTILENNMHYSIFEILVKYYQKAKN